MGADVPGTDRSTDAIRVGVAAAGDKSSLLRRLLPERSGGLWGHHHFSIFSPDTVYDWIVVLYTTGSPDRFEAIGDPANVAYVSYEPREPPAVQPGFHDQFSRLVVTDQRVRGPNVIRRGGTPWWVGLDFGDGTDGSSVTCTLDFDRLVEMAPPLSKIERISVIVSDKTLMPGHIARDRLLRELLRRPIARHLDVSGRGRRQIRDKWDAIAPNTYHLAIENSSSPHYWTEKISDAFLGFSFPIYWGCPNLEEYFPADSFETFNVFSPTSAVETITRVLDERRWSQTLPAIIEARRRVLDDHHPLTVLASVCDRPAAVRQSFTIRPWTDFKQTGLRREWWRTKRRIYRRSSRINLRGRPLWRFPP